MKTSRKLNLNELQVLLYFYNTLSSRYKYFLSPKDRETVKVLRKAGLIYEDGSSITITKKGEMFIQKKIGDLFYDQTGRVHDKGE
jgi:coproporphyrinogen III oxidase-like Fe-S oxidoreductase